MMAWEDVTGANPNVTRFLDFIAKAEGADWNTIVGGSKFSDFSRHPNVVGLRTADGPSTAAGRYQITGTTYNDVAPQLGINDFSQDSQNQIAIELIRRSGALDDVLKGNFEPAVNKLGGVWASLPSSPYNQPKRDWNFVKANLMNASSDEGWETVSPSAASNDAGWETVTPTTTKTENKDVKQPAAANPAPAPQRTAAQSFGLGTRNVLEGVEQAFTYPVRAVGEAASGIAGLLGQKELADTISRTVGMKNKGAGALVADAAGLAKPETKTEKVIAEGTKAAAGLLTGTVANKAVEKAPEAVKGVLNILMPGTSGTAGQVAKDVGIYGGLGASMEAAPAETAAGLAALAAGKAGVSKVVGPRISDALDERAAGKLLERSGAANVRQDAEILRRMAAEFNDPLRTNNGVQKVLSTKDLNGKISQSFLREADDLVSQLPKDFASKADLSKAVARGTKLSTDEIQALRNIKGGEQVADLIEAAKRTDVVTAAVAARGGILGNAAREVMDRAPAAILSGTTTGIPLPFKMGSTGLGERLLGRQTREQVSEKLVNKFARGANKVEERFGLAPSRIATQELGGIVKEADNAALANIMGAKREQVTAKRLAEEAAAKTAAEKEAQKLLKQQEAFAIREGGDIIKARQAAEKATAAKQAQETSAQAARDKAFAKAQEENRKVAQANYQANQQRLLEERAAEASAKAQREGALNAAQGANQRTAQANYQANQQRLLEERSAEGLAKSAADTQRAKALADAQKQNQQTAQANVEANRQKILAERKAQATSANQGALSALMEMSGGKDVGGGPLRATLDSFSKRYGIDDKAGMSLLRRMRDEATDPGAKGLLDSLLSNQRIDDLYGLQDIVAAYGKKTGAINNVPGGALSSETSRVFNQTSYDATVRTAEAARDAAIKSAPNPSLKQFAIDVANEKSPASKIEKLNDRLKAATDPEEIGYLLNMVEPLTKFGKKANK